MSEPTIYVIPEEYYGGKAPKGRKYASAPVTAHTSTTSAETLQKKGSLKKKLLLIAVGILFLLVIGTATWYFTKPLRALPVAPAPAVSPAPPPAPEPTAPPVAPVEELPAPLPEPTPPPPPTPPAPAAHEDTDRDGISNAEELLYGGSPTIPDTDQDGFLDGHEVVNLYNPSGLAPERLEAAGFVRKFEDDIELYAVLYPVSWTVALLEGARGVEFVAPEGSEQISLTVVDNPGGLSLNEWVSATYGGNLTNWNTNKAGFSAVLSISGGVRRGVFAGQGRLYVVEYSTATGVEAYRTTFEMMLNSFRVSEN